MKKLLPLVLVAASVSLAGCSTPVKTDANGCTPNGINMTHDGTVQCVATQGDGIKWR